MNTFARQSQRNPGQKGTVPADAVQKKQTLHRSASTGQAQRTIPESLNQSPQVQTQLQLQNSLNNSPQAAIQAKFAEALANRDQPLQRMCDACSEEEKKVKPKPSGMIEDEDAVAQTKSANSPGSSQNSFVENRTGLPNQLKSGIEALSDVSLDDVNVHYNSSKPAQLQALAYTQGSDIHVGPGQEQHLAHEAWHVVQQKQGRVQPTTQLQDVAINDDFGLEREADVMGEKALQMKATGDFNLPNYQAQGPIQRKLDEFPLTASSETDFDEEDVLQARLEPFPESAPKTEIPLMIGIVRNEIKRQLSFGVTNTPADARLAKAQKDLEKIESSSGSTPAARSIASLNRIIGDLNKNIDQSLIPDAVLVTASSSGQAASSSSGHDFDVDFKGDELDFKDQSGVEDVIPFQSLSEAQHDPRWQRAKDLGLLDDAQVRYWLQPGYLAERGGKGIPTNLKGVIVELQAKDAAEAGHEDEFIEGDVEVFKGVKIVDPEDLTETGRPRVMREIDVLVVRVLDDDQYVPIEVIEAKKQAGKKPKGLATDVRAKVKALREAQSKGWRVIAGDEDITDLLVPNPEVQGLTAGPTGEYDVRLPASGEAEMLYDFINQYRYALSRFWY
ncbi:MAG TPA: DUF4157 domain-containing protein [Acidobacteriota bacterium]|nr:DUF4157 domain-containing protein [Acidobacteriota bacterium]